MDEDGSILGTGDCVVVDNHVPRAIVLIEIRMMSKVRWRVFCVWKVERVREGREGGREGREGGRERGSSH